MEVATRCPTRSPTRGIAASKKPKMRATRTRSLPPTPERPMPIAAAKFDNPSATATSKIPDTEPT